MLQSTATVIQRMRAAAARQHLGSLWAQQLLASQLVSSSDATSLRSISKVAAEAIANANIRWVFLGPPGVGKGTYASRVSKHLGVAHIATGDLIRDEIKAGSAVGKQVRCWIRSSGVMHGR